MRLRAWIGASTRNQAASVFRSTPHPNASVRSAAFQLIEVVLVLVVVAVVASVGVPNLLRFQRGLRVDLAAREVAGVLRQARSTAVRYSTKVGVKFRFDQDGRVTFALYRDGDGDGVRTVDIERGIDPPMSPPRLMRHLGAGVRFGFPPDSSPVDPGDPHRRLDRLDDPIRLNRSDIASFNHLGGSTPGSLYLTDGIDHLSVVRVYGRSGKVYVRRYDAAREVWQ